MTRKCSFCFPEDTFCPNEFIAYLQFSKSFFSLAMPLVTTGFIDARIEDNEKLHFGSSCKGLGVVRYPKWSCSDHVKKNAFCGKQTRCTSDPTPVSVRTSCFGGEPVILISNKNNSSDFLLEGLGPGKVANHPACQSCTTSPRCTRQSQLAERLLPGRKCQ